MTPVVPYQIRKSEDGCRGELMLRIKNQKSAYMVQLPLEQARVIAVEMRGLGTDHCAHHHLTLSVAEALGGKVSHVVLRILDGEGAVMGLMRLTTPTGLVDVTVDVAAALSMAIHLALPIFLDGGFARPDGKLHAVEGVHPQQEDPREGGIPSAFRELIDHLDLSGPPNESDA